MTDEQSPGQPAAPPAACPKCGKKRPDDAEACPRCGLAFAQWKPGETPTQPDLDERGKELLSQVQIDWNDVARHEEFVKYCLQSNALAAAGRLYRERLDENPKDAIAAQMQAQVVAKATLSLSLYKSQAPVAITRSARFWLIVVIAMTIGIAAGLFWRRWR